MPKIVENLPSELKSFNILPEFKNCWNCIVLKFMNLRWCLLLLFYRYYYFNLFLQLAECFRRDCDDFVEVEGLKPNKPSFFRFFISFLAYFTRVLAFLSLYFTWIVLLNIASHLVPSGPLDIYLWALM